MTNIEQYILPLDNVDLTKVLSTWTWLVDNDKSIIALTKAGDAVLKDTNNKLYFLDIGGGKLNLITTNYLDFTEGKLTEQVIEELLLPRLVDQLEINNITLRAGQVYSYKMLPILGGNYDKNNIFAVDLYEHYNLTGEIHFQIKDLLDGTKVEIETEK